MPMIEKATPPPKKPAARKPAIAAPRPTGAARVAANQESVEGVGQLAAFLCVMRGNMADAGTIAEYAPPMAHEIALLAEENEQIAKVLSYLTASGPYAKLLTLALPFGLQLAANHGKVEASSVKALGVIDPSEMAKKAQSDAVTETGDSGPAQA